MEDKKTWVEEIANLLRQDKHSYVDRITYDKRRIGLELVTVTFKDGDTSTINVSGNSYSAILEEITREVYGGGAYGKVEPWERWW